MILAPWPPLFPSPAKFNGKFRKPLFQSPNVVLDSFISHSKYSARSSFKCSCTKKGNPDNVFERFSVLGSDIPWDSGSVWSTMALYFFSLHIPLSFGGLSVVAQSLHQPVLDPQTEAISLLVIQTTELLGALLLLKNTAKSQYKLVNFFQANNGSKERNWVQASALGFGFLILFVFLTSILADRLFDPKDVNNPILKEILSSGSISVTACFLVYCFVTPLLEEIVYRGFLLASLASTTKWYQAVIISSTIFSAAHFSGENSLQLFIIGCVFGCSYCWTGNLSSSIAIHSLYNAVTLMVTILS
ncbi:hypothetical protein HHK36_003705 [Tetracentron sinense]|uniref:CAAX prenyl protease 2/Lysostaphin resistance protein A-like domain-containing protein n=1 Tax=Tetracentron sinense TaxID=13715 RepID=A0A834ZRL8_TETSI|nr:hypothetical protein HHK36_003705 [Tetracentron sinense]